MTATDTTTTPTETEEAFRARCQAFLVEHATGLTFELPDPRGANELAAAKVFQQKVAAAGLAGVTYPKQYGGQGLPKSYDRIWREEYAEHHDMTGQLTISHGMCVPMLAEYGTDEQKATYLADAIAGRTVWCQMFSEPGAGSDVASLQTRAVLDGDEWTLNGQKVWTTLAHVSDYGIIVARTDPDVPKHAGISMFIVDMSAPGVDIRAINQIDGGQHFNEIFFTDVRLPRDALIGELNAGWRLATAMLMYERVAIGTGSSSGIKTPTSDFLIKTARKHGMLDDAITRQELMKIYAEETAKSLVSLRTRAELKAGMTPGPGGSLGKLHGAKIARMSRSVMMNLAGPASAAWDVGADDADRLASSTLRSFSSNIAGGTDEIQKNIIGDRVLGLPRDIAVDRDVAFKDLKVGTQSS
ncbi:MAG: acyl-CoA dehydrogenase family protein [Acidimicrobiia bacterium]|nr:acyl-CoA dehydrogenase family protein [Acidimicrobiia bacterium]